MARVSTWKAHGRGFGHSRKRSRFFQSSALRPAIGLATLGILAVPGAAYGQEVIQNGSFETVSNPGNPNTFCTAANWTTTGACNNNYQYNTAANIAPSDGNISINLTVQPGITLTQNIADLARGQYTFSFDYILVGGTATATANLGSTAFQLNQPRASWTAFSQRIVSTGGPSSVSFASSGLSNFSIDRVSVFRFANIPCDVTASGSVACADGPTSDSTNTNAASTITTDRHQVFSNGTNVTASVTDAVSGLGLALTNTSAGNAITLTNSGSITLNTLPGGANGGTAALNLATNNGAITYSGNGNVSAGGLNAVGINASAGTGDISMTIGGTVTGQTGLALSGGTTTLDLTGTITGTGGTAINLTAGTLEIAGTAPFGTLNGGIANAGTVRFNRADTIALSNVISGSGRVTQAGTGTTILSGANTYAGGTSITGGTLRLEQASAAGTGAIALNAGELSVGAGIDLDNDITVTGTGNRISVPDTGLRIFQGTLSLDGNLTLQGFTGPIGLNNQLAFVGANTATATSQLSVDGNVSFNTSDLVSQVARITIAPTGYFRLYTLLTPGGVTVRDLQGSGVVDFGGGPNVNDLTLLAGNFSGTLDGAKLAINTSDAVTLSDISRVNRVRVLAGRLILNASNAGARDEMLVQSGAALELQGGITLALGERAGTMTLNGTGIANGGALRSVSGTNSWQGPTVLGSNASIVSAAGQLDLFGNLDGDGHALTISGPGAVTMSGVLSNLSSLTKDGGNVLAIFSNSTYTGPTIVNGGSIQLSSGNALPDTGAVTLNGAGQIQLTTSETIGSLAGTGEVLFDTANITLSIGGANTSTTFSGIIRNNLGTGGITKTGTGTLTLSGTNAYSGATTISGGALQIGNGGASGTLGTGTVAISSGTELIFNRANAYTVANTIVGSGTITIAGTGTATFNANNSFGSAVRVQSGATLLVTNSGGLGANSGATTVNAGGTLALQGGIVIADALTLSGSGAGGNGALRNVADTNSVTGAITLAGDTLFRAEPNGATNSILSLGGTINGGGFALTTTGGGRVSIFGNIGNLTSLTQNDGVLGLLGNNSFTGPVTVNGGFLQLYGTGLADTVALTVNTGAFVQVVNSETIGSLAGGGTVAVNFSAGATLTVGGNGNSTTFAGSIVNGSQAGGLTKIGAGTLILTGANTYTGTTTISAGTLQIGNGGTTGSIGSANVLNNAALIINRSNSLTIANAISGSGVLVQAGPGTTILTGANTYSSTTTISAGTLQIGNGGTAGQLGSGAVINNASLVFNRSDIVVFGNDISGAGSVTQAGSGLLTLTGINSYSGGTFLNAGTVELSSFPSSQIGSGSVTFNGGALNAIGGTLGNRLVVTAAGGTFSTLTQTFTTLTGDVDWIGAMRFGRASYDGTTYWSIGSGSSLSAIAQLFVDAGTLRANDASLGIATATIASTTIAAGATLNFDGFNATIASLQGAGTLRNNAGGTTTIRQGIFSGAITGSGSLIKTTSGLLTLTGTNTYSGGTDIQFGTIDVGSNNALGTGRVDFSSQGGRIRAITDVTLSNQLFVTPGDDAQFAAAAGRTLTLSGASGGGFAGINVNATSPGNTIFRFGNFIDNGTIVIAATDVNVSGGGFLDFYLDGGTLRGSGSALGTLLNAACSRIVVNPGATLDLGGISSGGINNLAGNGRVLNDGGVTNIRDGALGGNLAGSQSINVGPGSLLLSGANTYSGTTTIGTGGSLILIGSIASTQPVSIAAGGSLRLFQSTDFTFANLIVGSGDVRQVGFTGITTLSSSNNAANNFTGRVFVDSGQLAINGSFGDAVNASAQLSVGFNATLSGSGTFLGDVTVQNNGTLSPGNSPGTFTIAGDLNLTSGATLNFELAQAGVIGGGVNDLIVVGGNLTLDGTLNVTALPGFGPGFYRLINYGGTLTDNGLTLGTLPGGGLASLRTDVAGQISILFGTQSPTQYWDGADTTGASTAAGGNGGSGTWSTASTNWTYDPDFVVNDIWRAQTAVFAGAAGGTVTVQGTQAFQELRFETGDYSLTAGAGAGLSTTGGFSIVDVTGALDALIGVGISGAVGLTKTGTGTLTLSGTNSYAGTTAVAAGTLTLDGGSAIADTGAVSIAAGATLNLAASETIGSLSGDAGSSLSLGTNILTTGGNDGSTIFAGTISGPGGLTKIGTGTLTLTGANSHAGTTTVSAGTLNIRDALALGTGAGGTIVQSGAALEIQGGITIAGEALSLNGTGIANGGALRSVSGLNEFTGPVTLTGDTLIAAEGGRLRISGTVDGGGNALFANAVAGRIELSGTVSDISSLTVGGLIILSGTNTYTGPTTVNGFLQLIGGAAIADTGAVVINSGGLVQVFNDETIGSLAGNGGIVLDDGQVPAGTPVTLTVGGNDVSTNFAGGITEDGVIGGLTKIGTGTLTLSGIGLHTGTTTISAGTLSVDGGLAIGDTSAMTIASGATLNLAASEAIGALSGASGSFITLGANTLVTDVATGGQTFAGIISGGGGVAKTGTGTLTLSGANTYTGDTSVLAGTLINNGTLAGTVRNAGTFVSTGSLAGGLVNTGTATIGGGFAGDIANDGGLTLTSDITARTLSGGGALTLGASRLTTGADGVNTLYGGVISGTGGLTKVGNGTLALSAANTYSGVTTISGGILQIGNGGTSGSIAGPVTNNAMLVINRSDAVTFAGAISGTGMLVQAGSGTTTLTGPSSYSGGTLISAGRLVGNTASLQRDIQNDAALEFAQTTNGIFAGRIGGTGTLDKSGAGVLELTGDNSALRGLTTIRGGELRVSSALNNSAVTVLSGATLSGTGVVGGLTVQSGGIISPGAGGIGTLGVNGNVTLAAGSSLFIQLQGGVGTDMLVATGTAQVGGTLTLTSLGGTYAFNTNIPVIQAGGSLTGTFSATSFSGFGSMYRPELIYTANGVFVRLAPNSLAAILGTTPITRNQASVVARVDGAIAAGYNPAPLISLFNLSPAQLPAALDQISGEIYATATSAGVEQDRFVRDAMLGRLSDLAASARSAPERANGGGMWGQVVGSWGDADGDGNAAGFDSDRQGYVMGIDYGNANSEGSWRVGLFGQYLTTSITVDARGSRAKVEQTGGGLYAGINAGAFNAAFGASYANLSLDVRRQVTLPNFSDTTRGNGEGKAFQGFLELSYLVPSGRWTFRPFVGLHAGSFELDALLETGGPAALSVRGQDFTSATATAGLNAAADLGRVRLSGTLAARAQLADRDPSVAIALAAAPSQTADIRGIQIDDVALSARLDAAFRITRSMDLSIGYTGLIAESTRDHGARATLSIRF